MPGRLPSNINFFELMLYTDIMQVKAWHFSNCYYFMGQKHPLRDFLIFCKFEEPILLLFANNYGSALHDVKQPFWFTIESCNGSTEQY